MYILAGSILVCPNLAKIYKNYAEELLQYFVLQGRKLYGPEFLVYNVHCLLHLTESLQEFDALDQCSAFDFENYLHNIKRLVRSGRNPLAQIVKRLDEAENAESQKFPKSSSHVVSCKFPNNAFLLDNNVCCEVVSLVSSNNESSLYLCKLYKKWKPFFDTPCDSSLLGVYVFDTTHTEMVYKSEGELCRKAILLKEQPSKSEAILMAILHDF